MKTLRKALCCLLAAIIFSGVLLLPAQAAQAASPKIPLIIVNGMGESPLLTEDGSAIAFPPSGDAITSAVFRVLPYLFKMLFTRNLAVFARETGAVLSELFDAIAFNPDGTPKHDLQQVRFPDSYAEDKTGMIGTVSHGGLARLYGAAESYQFVHDWRQSAFVEAERLNKMIEGIKKDTGCAKVSLVAVSMGGAVAMAYLARYGHGSLERVVMMNTVWRGLTVVGDLFNGRLTFDSFALRNFLTQMLEDAAPWNDIVGGLLGGLDAVGALDFLLRFIEALLPKLMPGINDSFIVPIFGQLPGFWGLVPDADYESAKAYLLDPVIHKDLIKLIDDYHYNVFNKVPQMVDAAVKDGVNFYVLSNYNIYGAPVGPNARVHTDDGLPTIYTSGGATCALLGETLPPGYSQAVACGHSHLSADGFIDASTCIRPEQTWFFKDLHHISFFSDDCLQFLLWLLEADGTLTVRSNAEYPQFMAWDKADGSLSAVR